MLRKPRRQQLVARRRRRAEPCKRPVRCSVETKTGHGSFQSATPLRRARPALPIWQGWLRWQKAGAKAMPATPCVQGRPTLLHVHRLGALLPPAWLINEHSSTANTATRPMPINTSLETTQGAYPHACRIAMRVQALDCRHARTIDLLRATNTLVRALRESQHWSTTALEWCLSGRAQRWIAEQRVEKTKGPQPDGASQWPPPAPCASTAGTKPGAGCSSTGGSLTDGPTAVGACCYA